jgi:hypothetical protein
MTMEDEERQTVTSTLVRLLGNLCFFCARQNQDLLRTTLDINAPGQ